MPPRDQIDIRQLANDEWQIEFDYNEHFIDWLKRTVPAALRSYDPDTHIWTLKNDHFVAVVSEQAKLDFKFATKIYRNQQGEMVWRNLHTGAETVQKGLFA